MSSNSADADHISAQPVTLNEDGSLNLELSKSSNEPPNGDNKVPGDSNVDLNESVIVSSYILRFLYFSCVRQTFLDSNVELLNNC